MTTTPDYAAIDWVLENVEGARPEREILGRGVCTFQRCNDFMGRWGWFDTNDIAAALLDEPDALAILRDWW